jgi:RNA-directed DNA polymerase
LRALLHNCVVHGWESQARGRSDFREHLLGRLAWISGLDPTFGAKLRSTYDRIDWAQ